MDIARISTILADCAGEIDDNQQPVEGSELFNFFVVAFPVNTAKVHERAAEMIELLKEWPSESWGYPVPKLGEEISYITAGGVLDDQFRAFALFAFGKIMEWWFIMDPHTVLELEYDDPQGHEIARMGLVPSPATVRLAFPRKRINQYGNGAHFVCSIFFLQILT